VFRALFTPLLFARGAAHRAQKGDWFVAVQMHFVVLAVGRVPLFSLLMRSGSPAIAASVGIQSLWLISCCHRPADHARQRTMAARGRRLPVVFFSERSASSRVRPGVHVWAVVAAVDDDGVVGDSQSSSALSSVRWCRRARACRRRTRCRRACSDRDATAHVLRRCMRVVFIR